MKLFVLSLTAWLFVAGCSEMNEQNSDLDLLQAAVVKLEQKCSFAHIPERFQLLKEHVESVERGEFSPIVDGDEGLDFPFFLFTVDEITDEKVDCVSDNSTENQFDFYAKKTWFD